MLVSDIKDKICTVLRADSHFDDIKSVGIFGSYVTGGAGSDSDIDLLIDFMPGSKIGLLAFGALRDNLEKTLSQPVDLLTENAIGSYFRDEIIRQAELVYER